VTALQGGKHYNVVKLTPAHLELLSQQLSPEEMATMSRVFVIGGEQLLAESLRPWRRHAPGTRLFNEYGPTETVVGCCVHEVHAADAHQGAIPIGRPIANTRLYILDDELQPVPPGVVGELYIGGAGVARGYLNRPKVTEERFLPDPFSPAADDRLYKTGDLARQREDGSLEYLGRLDSQVKVRGYRVELGEIEASLALHPEVKSCVVLAPETSPGDRQLAAYVIPGTRPPSPRALQDHLRQRLPEFMVPDRMVFLETFPLTPNGKLDREALLALPLALMSAEPATRPATPVESSLLTIWNDLLRLDRLGIDEDLFVLGARSLQAVRAVTRIRTTFDVDLQLRHLFEQPTIAGQAKIIEGLQWLAASKMTRTRPHVLEEIEL
jgi:acyl-coenzyme A synthetase/AMP-(fatty) acid ligase